MLVGYQGAAGAFSESAVKNFFEGREYESRGYSDFISMLADTESGKLDYAMFPVENTTTGIIARTYDHFKDYKIHAVGEVIVPIHECLITHPDAVMEDLTEVYSHPEAISQCQGLFDRHPNLRPVAFEDTALAVSYIRESGLKNKAALASELAAETYGMKVLIQGVQDNGMNMTRFLCMTSKDETPEDADKISIRFVTSHTPGSLYNALGVFASLNINVLKLESRPIFGRVFDYCFYLDFAGSPKDPDVAEALRRLEYDCTELNMLGSYRAADTNTLLKA